MKVNSTPSHLFGVNGPRDEIILSLTHHTSEKSPLASRGAREGKGLKLKQKQVQLKVLKRAMRHLGGFLDFATGVRPNSLVVLSGSHDILSARMEK